MEPFSAELLTILTLVSLILSGVTFLIVLIIVIILIYRSRSTNPQVVHVDRLETKTTTSPVLDDYLGLPQAPVPPVEPIRTDNSHRRQLLKPEKQQKKQQQQQRDEDEYSEDSVTVVTELPKSSYYHNKKIQQQKYRNDENDDNTTIDKYRINNQSLQRAQRRAFKPFVDGTHLSRSTPYPQDVLVREELMKRNRIGMDNKY